MTTKITVNGVSYDGIDAMPPEARRLYAETLANTPELADRDGDGIPDIVAHPGAALQHRTVVRKKFIVNGTSYDDPAAMPPDARAMYDKAMSAMQSGQANVHKNEIKLSFQLTGPGFSIRKSTGTETSASASAAEPQPSARRPAPMRLPAPIEPSASGGMRMTLVVGACAAVGLLLWLTSRGH